MTQSIFSGRLFPDASFEPVEDRYFIEAKKHLDQLTKPQGSLGQLECIAMRLFAIGRGKIPLAVDPCIVYTVAADHGVACQNVSPFPQAVTRQMVMNYLAGGAAINVLCATASVEGRIVDAGCVGPRFASHPALIDRRVGDGTGDISQKEAMSMTDCVHALRSGYELACQAASDGYRCIGTGELGIANSTTATALYCAFLGLEPEKVSGPGSGAREEMIAQKSRIVHNALQLHGHAIEKGDPVAILAALGGFEIAMLSGIMLGCAANRLPLVVDGFICLSAYVAACAIYPHLSGYAFLSHVSAEPGFKLVIGALDLPQRPLLNLDLRLGEGTGVALALPVLRGAANIYNCMATMASANVTATEADRLD